MPYGRPDPSDPNVLVGVRLPTDEDGLVEMAYTFAEEFAALGHDEERILRVRVLVGHQPVLRVNSPARYSFMKSLSLSGE